MSNEKTPKMDEYAKNNMARLSANGTSVRRCGRRSNAEIREEGFVDGFAAGKVEGIEEGVAKGRTEGAEHGAAEARRFFVYSVLLSSGPCETSDDVFKAAERYWNTAKASGMRHVLNAMRAHEVLRNQLCDEEDPEKIFAAIRLFVNLADHGAALQAEADKKAAAEKKADDEKALAEMKAEEKAAQDALHEKIAEKAIMKGADAAVKVLLGSLPKASEADFTGLTVEEKNLCHSGRKIDAIKLVRKRTGLGLKKAKDLVDAFSPSPLYRSTF